MDRFSQNGKMFVHANIEMNNKVDPPNCCIQYNQKLKHGK